MSHFANEERDRIWRLNMTELLDDYRKATFPLEVNWGYYGSVRLLAGFENGVVGVTFYQSVEDDGKVIETLSQALTWDGQGIYADGQYPEMNLPPPPAHTQKRALELQDEIRVIQDRLDANPEAPPAWRIPDENRVKCLEKQIAKLIGA